VTPFGFESRWRDALLDALIPSPGNRLPALADVDRGSFWRRFEQAAPWTLRAGFRTASLALGGLAPVLLGYRRTFPRGWKGAHYLDYGFAGNPFGENLGYTPLVAVNEGDMSLLLGWEVFKLGPLFVPLRDYWALRLEGPLEEVVPQPRDAA